MNAIVADDFTITFPDGSQQTKPQIMASLKGPRTSGRPVPNFYTENVQARVYGDTVILSGRVVTEYRRDGQVISKRAPTLHRHLCQVGKEAGAWLRRICPTTRPRHRNSTKG